jgi:gas vesicle protein
MCPESDDVLDECKEEPGMKKFFSLAAGLLSGSVVGATVALLLAPESGADLRADAQARWERALQEARAAMERTEAQKTAEFEQMKLRGRLD